MHHLILSCGDEERTITTGDQSYRKVFLATALLFALVIGLSVGSADADNRDTAIVTDELTQSLRESGWPIDAARQVARVNARAMAADASENQTAYRADLVQLRGLGASYEFMPFLARHPEAAFLVLQSADRRQIVRALDRPDRPLEEQMQVVGLFQRYTAPDEADALAVALNESRPAVMKLVNAGLLETVPFLMRDRTRRELQPLHAWVVQVVIETPPEQLPDVMALVAGHFRWLQNELAADPALGPMLTSRLWPRLRAAYNEMRPEDRDLVAAEPRVWRLLQRADGPALLSRLGINAIAPVYGYPPTLAPYPDDLQPLISSFLLNGPDRLTRAVLELQDEPGWHDLLRRMGGRPQILDCHVSRFMILDPVDPSGRITIDWQALSAIQGMTDEGKIQECVPASTGLHTYIPGYGIINAVRKHSQGRELDWFDGMGVAGDILVFVPIVRTAGAGIKAAGVFIAKKGAQTAATQVGKAGVSTVSKRAVLAELRSASARLGPREALDVTSRDVALRAAAGGGRATPDLMQKLGARLLTLRDGITVVTILGDTAATGLRQYLRETAESLAFGLAAETPAGREALRTVMSPIISQWQEHVAVWFVTARRGRLDGALLEGRIAR